MISHSPLINSNHRPLIIHCSPPIILGPKPFSFEAFWLRDPMFLKVVIKAWNDDINNSYGMLCLTIYFTVIICFHLAVRNSLTIER